MPTSIHISDTVHNLLKQKQTELAGTGIRMKISDITEKSIILGISLIVPETGML